MRRWVQSVSEQGQPRGPPCVEVRSARDLAQPLRWHATVKAPCDFLTCIFHGLALVHGTTQELCRSTATVWFMIPSSPSRIR